MIGTGTGAANFATSGMVFMVTSSDSSWVQKKVYSESDFGRRDDGDGEAILCVSSASGIQKKDSSEMGFVRGDTGRVETFVGGAIQSLLTC